MRQRARRDEDKAERVGAILDAARELWSRVAWSEFTVGAAAEGAGIVKGTVYLYFTSKERLLLAVFESYFEEFFDDVDRTLERTKSRLTPAHVANIFAEHLRGREPFLRILPILGGVLEHNLDYPAALAFKQLTLDRLVKTAALVERRMRIRPGDGLRILKSATALLIGLASTAFPSSVIQQVFHDDPRLSVLRTDLHREFLDGLTALLRGMER